MMRLDLVAVALILGHLLGDFIFQIKPAGGGRPISPTALIKDVLVYCAGILIAMLFYFKLIYVLPLLVIMAGHAGISVLYSREAGIKSRIAQMSFGVYQGLQLFLLLIIAFWVKNISTFNLNDIGITLQNWLQSILPVAGIEHVLRISLLATVLSKPANVFIKLFLSRFSYGLKKPGLTDAGQVIGTLERYVVAFFVILQQYAAIGLVFTAKSIARYNKISEEPEFAEYYLVGSLLSVLTAVVSTVFIYQIYN